MSVYEQLVQNDLNDVDQDPCPLLRKAADYYVGCKLLVIYRHGGRLSQRGTSRQLRGSNS